MNPINGIRLLWYYEAQERLCMGIITFNEDYYRRKLEEYENKPRGIASVEWYDCVHGEKTDPDYHSAIWLPVSRKR